MPDCHWDPQLEHDPKAYACFLADLAKSMVIQWTRDPRVHIACFFVLKKSGRLRLVIDARRANILFFSANHPTALWAPPKVGSGYVLQLPMVCSSANRM